MRRRSSTSTSFCQRIWLAVADRGERHRVALTDATNLQATTATKPRRVTVMLPAGPRSGRDVGFLPASRHGFPAAFKPDPSASEFILRVGAVRQAAR